MEQIGQSGGSDWALSVGEQLLVQILVVVANIQMRTVETEVDNEW